MDFTHFLSLFTPADLAAIAYCLAGAWLLKIVIESPNSWRPSVTVLMMRFRRDWLHEFVTRDPRIFDAAILDGLRQGITFYASTCMVALGGGLALLGDTAPLIGLTDSFSLNESPALLMKAKIIFVLAFMANAFLKFVWSHRLFAYCSIIMASVPNDPHHPLAYPQAARAAEININAARNYNRGLRSLYFAVGALGWIFGPWGLFVTISLTFATLIRHEFASQSRAALMAHYPLTDAPPLAQPGKQD